MINILGRCPKSIKLPSIVRLSSSCKQENPPCTGKIDPPYNLKCKVAVISGGTGGMGQAIARALLTEKVRNIALISSDICKGSEAVNQLNCCFGKGKAIFLHCDVQNKAQVAECYDKIMKEFKQIHILVNTASVFDGCNWEKEVNTGLVGTINNMLQAYKVMGDESVILNVSGIFGLDPLPPGPTISAVHSGIISLSRSFGHFKNAKRSGIRVVALCAGVTNSGFLKNAAKKALYNDWKNDLELFLSKAERQNVDVCAKSAIYVTQKGVTGSVWAVVGSKLYSLKIPHWKTYRVLESQLI